MKLVFHKVKIDAPFLVRRLPPVSRRFLDPSLSMDLPFLASTSASARSRARS
jgi:hypothetical protein